MPSIRKKLVLFPPMQTFPTNVVSIAAGGITSGSFAANAISASAFSQGAADKVWSTAARALTDKVGFSLTAGSYSIRASSTQRGTIALSSVATANGTIASVTQTRAIETSCGFDVVGASDFSFAPYVQLTAPTTVTATRTTTSSTTSTAAFSVAEYF